MYNHAPEGYVCPLCLSAQGIENDQTMVKQADIVYRDDFVFAMINSKFAGKNPGHVIVVPIAHTENIYEIPQHVAHRVIDVAQQMAIALKSVRACDGVMTQQNNEPASGQHAFHYYLHLFPRFQDDHFAETSMQVRVSEPSERLPYAEALKGYFQSHPLVFA
jgi:histidine triad (HIT) family protein